MSKNEKKEGLLSEEMEFLCEVVKQITEERFGEQTYTYDMDSDMMIYTENAQDFFNKRYDEVETLYITLLT